LMYGLVCILSMVFWIVYYMVIYAKAGHRFFCFVLIWSKECGFVRLCRLIQIFFFLFILFVSAKECGFQRIRLTLTLTLIQVYLIM